MGKKTRRNRASGKVKNMGKRLAAREYDDGILSFMSELVAVLKSSSGGGEQLLRTMSAICSAVFDYDDAPRALLDIGGVETIVSAMRKSPRSEGCQICGCKVLAICSVLDTEECNRVVSQSGGIPIVAAALKRLVLNYDGESIQDRTRGVLAALLTLENLSAQHVKSIMKAGGIQAIVSALKIIWPHEYTTKVAGYAMQALLHIISSVDKNTLSSAISKIIACGGIPTILACMTDFSNDSSIREAGCAIMTGLSNSSVGGDPSAALAAGGHEAIRMVLEMNEGEKDPLIHRLCVEVGGYIKDIVPLCRCCGRESENMMVCNRCDIAWYCNDECIARDWKNHKAACNAARWKTLSNVKHT